MQNLLVALKEFSMDEIKAIRNSDVYGFRAYKYGIREFKYGIRAYGKNDPKVYRIYGKSKKDLDYAIFDSTKNFLKLNKVNRINNLLILFVIFATSI